MNVGTFAYGLSAGASAAVGVVFLMIGLRRRSPRRLELALGAYGFAAAVGAVAHVQLLTSDDVAEYASSIKGPFALAGLVSLAALVWLVAAVTETGWPRVPVFFSVWAAVTAMANSLAPGGLIVEEVTELRSVSLLGEEFVLHQANTSSWRIFLDAFLLGIVVYVGLALLRSWRRGTKIGLLGPGIALLVFPAVVDSLIDEGVFDIAYITPFLALGFSLLLALELATRVGISDRQLSRQSEQMDSLIATRTRSLRLANRRIAEDLERQQRDAHRLARLTHQLVNLNAVAVRNGGREALERELFGAVVSLGRLMRSERVDLVVDGAGPPLDGVNLCWVDPRSQEPGDSGGEPAKIDDSQRPRVRHLPLRIGDVELGSLSIGPTRRGDPASDHQQLAGLVAEYLAATLKRVELEAALVESAIDTERQRIARDLHDSVSQRLYAAAFNAEALIHSAADGPEQLRATAETVRGLVLSAMAEMRTLVFELQPEALDSARLTTLIDQLCTSMSTIRERPILVSTTGEPVVPAGEKLALYRIAQESLGNALRHSQAATISVSVAETTNAIELRVTDDGIGFDLTTVRTGNGIRNVRERARQIGAELAVDSVTGVGTTVSVVWPRCSDGPVDLDLRYSRTELAER